MTTRSPSRDAGIGTAAATPTGLPRLGWARSRDGRHHLLDIVADGGGPPGWAICGRWADSPPVRGEPGNGCVSCWRAERQRLHARIRQLAGERDQLRQQHAALRMVLAAVFGADLDDDQQATEAADLLAAAMAASPPRQQAGGRP